MHTSDYRGFTESIKCTVNAKLWPYSIGNAEVKHVHAVADERGSLERYSVPKKRQISGVSRWLQPQRPAWRLLGWPLSSKSCGRF